MVNTKKQTAHISQTQETRCRGTHNVFGPSENNVKDCPADFSATILHHIAYSQAQGLDDRFKVFRKREDAASIPTAEPEPCIEPDGRYIEVHPVKSGRQPAQER